ncbi:hypothetical protein [Bufonid herpesvirus 1]|uniref:hypothetical protein n=1 Tax=Bufonid herpesvirus 1 TaxID=2282206 RepID=UPI000EB7903F|nr:hypothetical protein [Bufonid herpesvirus 1]AXF48596.1 hypothetical protein [Bufonid herpesvirus 1]
MLIHHTQVTMLLLFWLHSRHKTKTAPPCFVPTPSCATRDFWLLQKILSWVDPGFGEPGVSQVDCLLLFDTLKAVRVKFLFYFEQFWFCLKKLPNTISQYSCIFFCKTWSSLLGKLERLDVSSNRKSFPPTCMASSWWFFMLVLWCFI